MEYLAFPVIIVSSGRKSAVKCQESSEDEVGL